MLTLDELIDSKKPTDIVKFAEYVLNKVKRDGSAIVLSNGYIMAGQGCFIINDAFYKRRDAKEFIINLCNNV